MLVDTCIESCESCRALEQNAAAVSTIRAKSPEDTHRILTSCDPTPTAAAPLLMKRLTLSSDTPPTGIRWTPGNSCLISRTYCGPNIVAGKIFTIRHPNLSASDTSDGDRTPGTASFEYR